MISFRDSLKQLAGLKLASESSVKHGLFKELYFLFHLLLFSEDFSYYAVDLLKLLDYELIYHLFYLSKVQILKCSGKSPKELYDENLL
ncbi:MAG: hypothetical protein RMK75_07685 [Aquificaceae bacterium]|nr:hypothetical protein [Aquificaceae bacterium]MDW8424180.1 hypothetical protein [Aquificaceae bacterium]